MRTQNRAQTSSSMEEVAAKRPEEVRAPAVTTKPEEALSAKVVRTPPQSARSADSSSIEEERGARAWLRRRAREMRTEMTPPEKAMWRLLHEGELIALNWRRQVALGNYIADFLSHSARIIVEIDGSQHSEAVNVEHDVERDAWFAEQGYRVVRFWNADVLNASDGVWRTIHEAAAGTKANARMSRWRADHMAQLKQNNAQIASSSMEEAPRSGGGGARSVTKDEPREAPSSLAARTPPQSVARATDSSSIEQERS